MVMEIALEGGIIGVTVDIGTGARETHNIGVGERAGRITGVGAGIGAVDGTEFIIGMEIAFDRLLEGTNVCNGTL